MLFINLLIILILHVRANNPFPKIIWLYWQSGFTNAPQFTQLCLLNIKSYAKQDNWQVRQVNSSNQAQWVNNYGRMKQIMEKYNQQSQSGPKRADLLRLNLLRSHGGIWMDANVILMEDLSWFDRLQQDENFLNKQANKPPKVLMFYQMTYGSYKKEEYNGRLVMPNPGIQSWFIAAVPGSTLISDSLDRYEDFLIKGKDQVDRQSDQHKQDLSLLYRSYYLKISIAIVTTIQDKQIQLNKQIQPKYAVHQYGLWTANCNVGPLKLQSKFFGFVFWELLYFFPFQMLMQKIQQIQRKSGSIAYFVKVTNVNYRKFQPLFKSKFQPEDMIKRICPLPLRPFGLDRHIFASNFAIQRGSIIQAKLLRHMTTKLDIPIAQNVDINTMCQLSYREFMYYNWALIFFCVIIFMTIKFGITKL